MATIARRRFSDMDELKKRLRGALAFPITPFDADDKLDLAGMKQNVDWLAGSGVCAVVAPSGTGEFFALSADEVRLVTQATVDAVAGRVPVIAGVGVGPRVAADMAAQAEEVGASAVMVLPPYYAQPDSAGLLAYYERVCSATTLGVIPYARDAALFDPAMVVEMASRCPNMVGFKDGRGDVRLFQRIRETVVDTLGADRLVWLAGVGDDLVAPYFAAGAEGFTSSLACFWPEISLQLYHLASQADWVSLRSLHLRAVRPFYELRAKRRGYEISVMKAALELLGHRAGLARPPIPNLTDPDRQELRSILQELNVPTAQERGSSAGR